MARLCTRAAVSAGFLCAFLFPAIAYEIPEVAFPTLPETAGSAEAFVPPLWGIEVLEKGDLNADGRDDLLFVLKGGDPASMMTNDPASPGMAEWDANPRILAVAFAQENGSYRLALESDEFLPRHEVPFIDDPFGGAEIADGYIRIYLHYWANAGSWYTSDSVFAFGFLDGAFRLIAYSNYTTKRNTGETWDLALDYLAGSATLTIGSFSDDEAGERDYERSFPAGQLTALGEIGPGWDFYPEQSDLSWWGIGEDDSFDDGE